MATTIEHHDIIVIGGGQAGLSMGYYLKQQGIDHIILDKGQVADAWRHERWDNFCLVTPNWQCQLPGFHYRGDDPDGFMLKHEIIQYIEDYVAFFAPPLKNGIKVEELSYKNGFYCLCTTAGMYSARGVVVACGSYHYPKIPAMAAYLPEQVAQIHASQYKNSAQLPSGGVLVVGSGQSGCQIAEDLHLAGRQTYLSVGSAPRVARRYRGKDVVNWLDEMGYYAMTVDQHPDGNAARKKTNHYVSGRGGGRDINLRVFAQQGMTLYGRLASIHGYLLNFKNDLQQNLDNADAAAERINQDIEQYIVKNKISAPQDHVGKCTYLPEIQLSLDLKSANIHSVIWSSGFAMDFSWIKLPVFEPSGQPEHIRGITKYDGLYFLGLNWQNTWGSGRFYHVGNDALFLLEQIRDRRVNSSLNSMETPSNQQTALFKKTMDREPIATIEQ